MFVYTILMYRKIDELYGASRDESFNHSMHHYCMEQATKNKIIINILFTIKILWIYVAKFYIFKEFNVNITNRWRAVARVDGLV